MALGILGILLGDWQRAGLVTTVVVIGFFGYGHAWNAATQVLDTQWPLIAAWLLLVGLGLYLALRARRGLLLPATRALNLVAVVLVALNVWSLGSTMVAFGAATNPAPARAERPRAEARGPDRPARRVLHRPGPLRRADRPRRGL